MIHLEVKNNSARKRFHTRPDLQRLARRILAGEGVEEDVELSLLLCDDPFIRDLNRNWRNKDAPTDVLAFGQDVPAPPGAARVLGDIVISLETVERQCRAGGDLDRGAMRREVRLLFCHALLHLLGWEHDTAAARKAMNAKQARYLNLAMDAAWRCGP